jgi:lipopolysaccharide exporter
MTLETQARSGIRWTGLSAIFTTSIESLRLVILARFLSPVDFGLMGMAMVVIGLAQAYTDLGISGAIIHRQDTTKEQLSSLYWLNILTGFVAFSLVWLCVPLIVLMFREPRLLPILQVVAVVFIIAPAGKQFEILLQKELKFDVLGKLDVVASLVGFVVAIASAVFGFGVWALVHSLVVTVSLRAIFLFGIGWTRCRPHFHFRRSDLRGFLAFGLYQLGERTVNYTSERLDQLLIGTMLGAQALGFYNFAFNLTANPIWRINPIITRVAFPVFAKIQHDTEGLRKGYIRLIRVLTTINAPLLFGLAAVAPLAVPMIFGEKWSPSIQLIQVLSFVALLRSTGNPIGSLLLAKGRADLGFKWNIVFSLVCVPAILAGAIMGEVIGVAISLLLVQVVMQVPAYLYLIRPLVGGCAQEYGEAILKPIALAGVMGLIVTASVHLFAGFPQVPRLIAQISVGTSLYLVLLRVFDNESLHGFRRMLFAR